MFATCIRNLFISLLALTKDVFTSLKLLHLFLYVAIYKKLKKNLAFIFPQKLWSETECKCTKMLQVTFQQYKNDYEMFLPQVHLYILFL